MGQKRRKRIRLLQEQEETLKSQIAERKKELDALYDEHSSLVEEIRELEMAEEASRFTKTVSKINKENSMVIHLNKYSKTTPIMDSFAFSDKEFLVFRHVFRLAPSWKYISLIVAKNKEDINYAYSGLTMTDLKSAVGSYVSKDCVEEMSERNRLYPLYLELVRIGKKVAMMDGPIRFDKPCLLRGQTFEDQSGFGWVYCGEELVHRGRDYGDATRFMIIGVWVDPTNQ